MSDAYGSSCPFCLSEVPVEAVVCRGCGAEKGKIGSVWRELLGLLLFLSGGFIAALTILGENIQLATFFGVAVCVAGWKLMRYRKPRWLRR